MSRVLIGSRNLEYPWIFPKRREKFTSPSGDGEFFYLCQLFALVLPLGSSSIATACAGSLALLDAGNEYSLGQKVHIFSNSTFFKTAFTFNVFKFSCFGLCGVQEVYATGDLLFLPRGSNQSACGWGGLWISDKYRF